MTARRPPNEAKPRATLSAAKLAGAGRIVGSALRVWWLRLIYPGLKVGRRVELGSGVRIVVKRGGQITIGDRTAIEPNCLVVASAGTLEIGSDSFIGQGSVIAAHERVSIGADALIASNVTIRDQDHGTGATPYRLQQYVTRPVTIGSNVWLGAGVVVLKGVSIGDNAIVGANAVVTKSLPASATAVGVPAKVLR